MKRFQELLVLVLCMIYTYGYAISQEVDEFDSLPEIEVPSTPTTKDEAIKNLPRKIPQDPYHLGEIIPASCAIVYIISYLIGRSKNKQIAFGWLEEVQPFLATQFSYTRASSPTIKENEKLIKESVDNYKYYCTGRRFCNRFLVDLQLVSRQDLFSRIYRLFFNSEDILTIDVGLNEADTDPFVLGVSKKSRFNDTTIIYPELLSLGKRIENVKVPQSMCLATDCLEVPQFFLTKQVQQKLEEFEPFLEHLIITDQNARVIVGMPKGQKHLLSLKMKLQSGSKCLDNKKAMEFVAVLIDAIGCTFKLSRDGKRISEKKRDNLKAASDEARRKEEELQRRQTELREKKRQEYESLSYEEQQKRDELQQKKLMRKRFNKVKK